MRLNAERRPVMVYFGKGNNGGDGFVIARHLDIHGWPVAVAVCADPATITGDAATNYRAVKASGIPSVQLLRRTDAGDVFAGPANLEAWRIDMAAMQSFPTEPGWIVDGLFGTGLDGPIHGLLGTLIAGINKARASGKVLAIDIPSGLDCDTGEPLGPTIRATHTTTFVAQKRGFLNPAAREWTGEVHVIDIGAPQALVDEYRGD